MGGTDCGFAQGAFLQRVHPTIQWAKLQALAEGAKIATKQLFGAEVVGIAACGRQARTRRGTVRPWRWPLPFASAGAKIPAPYGAADRHGGGSGPREAGFLVGRVVRRLPPAPDPRARPGSGSSPRCGPTSSARSSFFRIAAAPNTMLRTSRAIAAYDPECLHVSVIQRGQLDAAQEGRCAVVASGRHGQLRDVASGDRPSGEALRGAGDEGAAPPAGPRGGADQQAHRAQASGQRRDHESSRGLPARVVQRPRGRLDHSGGRALRPWIASSTSSGGSTPGRCARTSRPRCGRVQRSCSTSSPTSRRTSATRTSRPSEIARRELHLDAVPAQAVRGRGDERVPVDPRRAPRPLPAGPGRSGAARTRRSWRSRAAGA